MSNTESITTIRNIEQLLLQSKERLFEHVKIRARIQYQKAQANAEFRAQIKEEAEAIDKELANIEALDERRRELEHADYAEQERSESQAPLVTLPQTLATAISEFNTAQRA